MIFTFYPDVISDIDEIEVISGQSPFHFANSEYLVIQNGNKKRAYRIIYECHCSPFKKAVVQDDLLLVGHEEHFYMYDIHKKESLLVLKMNGYFGHFYIENDYFLVADAEGLFCVDKEGNIVWHNKNLGIDGVIVEKITENRIHGIGEWDPPGGWRDFIVDKKTGESTTLIFPGL